VNLFRNIVLLAAIVIPPSVNAGIYTDDLTRCLVESSTPKDKVTLVKWVFIAMALHPVAEGFAAISTEQRDTANKGMAELMVKLISARCIDQSKNAIQYEGAVAIQSSFSVFGQIAGKELFANTKVAEGLGGLDKHIDSDLIYERLGIAKLGVNK